MIWMMSQRVENRCKNCQTNCGKQNHEFIVTSIYYLIENNPFYFYQVQYVKM